MAMNEIPIERRMALVEDDVRAMRAMQVTLIDSVARYRQLLFGDSEAETPGMLKRINTLEKLVEISEIERAAQRNIIKGMAIAIGVSSITGIGTFITVLSQILGAGGIKP